MEGVRGLDPSGGDIDSESEEREVNPGVKRGVDGIDCATDPGNSCVCCLSREKDAALGIMASFDVGPTLAAPGCTNRNKPCTDHCDWQPSHVLMLG